MTSRTLLVIENDPALVDLVSFAFTEQGYVVHAAFDGDHGVRLALELRPDAILCDVIMGEMHGFDVLRTLRADPATRDTVIVMTSAKAYKPDIDRARELGATDYVVKPYQTDDLAALVDGHLAAQAKREA